MFVTNGTSTFIGQEATVDLMSDAPIEDGNSKFNDPQTVTCTGSTNSLSPDLDITMTVTSVDVCTIEAQLCT